MLKPLSWMLARAAQRVLNSVKRRVLGQRSIGLRGLLLGLTWLVIACGPAAKEETDTRTTADRAIPPPAYGMESDGPTAPRTAAQRPTQESKRGKKPAVIRK